MDKKTIIAYFRGKSEYIDLLQKLHNSGKYNLIVSAEISKPLADRNIPFDILESYLTAVTRESSEDVNRRLRKLFGMYAFQKKFTFNGKSFFNEIAPSLFDNLAKQFAESIYLIDGFNNLFKHRKVDLVIVWTDVLRMLKTLTATAQSNNIPVLQLLHGGFSNYQVGHYENKIHADKVANLAADSKDFFSFYRQDTKKIVETGRIEFDYISAPSVTRDAACSLLGLNPKHPIVVFGTTWTFPYSSKYNELLQNINITNNVFLEAFARLKKIHANLQLLIKVHPSFQEPFSPRYFVELAENAGIDDAIVTSEYLQEALIACDLLVSFPSNICLDVLLLDKSVVILDLKSNSDNQYFFKNYSLAYIRDPDDTYEIIKRALFDDKFKARLDKNRDKSKYYFNYLNDGKAAERIMDLIDEMTGNL